MKYGTLGLCSLLICLGACNALGSADTRATLQAEQTAYIEESSRIAETLEARGTEVVATARAAETYVANAEGINRQLAATLRAVNPPTQQVVDTSGQVTPGMIANPGELSAATSIPATPVGGTAVSSDINMLTEVNMATGIRQSDGCANDAQTQFPASATSIYLTARVMNATAGTTVSAEWLYEGQLVVQSDGFTISEDAPDFCVWFYIEPTDAPFSPGSWSAQFVINGVPAEPAALFTIG